MIAVFVHQNFPGQYLHIVRSLAEKPETKLYFITQTNHFDIPGVHKLVYQPNLSTISSCHAYTATFDAAVRTGTAVAEVCRGLRDRGVLPDIIVGHCGWGETLFVKDVFPNVPLLSYFEFFYHSEGADVGFDPEFAPSAAGDHARLQVRNAVNRLAFAESDWGHTATAWQRSLFPAEMQTRIWPLHEGVDTARVRPDPTAWIKLARADQVLTKQDEVITYVSRNLEPYRGFHIFMRALPEILRRRSKVHVVIVGGDGLSYSDPPPYGGTFRQMLLTEVGEGLDLDRIHFLGQVPYETYLNVLQVSSVHVYLTYPFVLSWSFIEAMSAGCVIVGSATPPVLEVLRDGVNGLAVDFFSTDAICDRVDEVLDDPSRGRAIGAAARATAIRDFDTNAVILPRWDRLLHTLVERRLPVEQPPEPGPATRTNQR
ncbi:MAG: glycosyltransferase family 4 protein [Bryobacteraceae bacterium]